MFEVPIELKDSIGICQEKKGSRYDGMFAPS